MHRAQWITRGLVAAAVVLAPIGSPAAASAAAGPDGPVAAGACRMRFLPVPDGIAGSRVTGGDHSGRHLVGEGLYADAVPGGVGLHWVDGKVRVLDTSNVQPPDSWLGVADVNSHGVVVGFRGIGTHLEGWVYRNGRATLLPSPGPGDATQPAAINDRGDIVGMSTDATGLHPVLWPADQPGTVRKLTIDGQPVRGWGVDVDNDGTVLGHIGGRPEQGQHPYVWRPDGTGFPLAAADDTAYPEAMAIRGQWVAGYVFGPGYSMTVRWDLRTGAMVTLPGPYFPVTAVNRQGTVGAATVLIHRDGRVRDLGGYVVVVSDRGIVAGSTDQQLILGGSALLFRC